MREGETRGERVYNEGATQHGLTTGGIRPCTLEGCRGDRIAVRWPDGELTYPCTEGMFVRTDGDRQIMGREGG